MLFSSVTFLYWFLPAVLALYFITPAPGGSMRWRNALLLVASLVFYAWGEPVYVLLMAAEAVIGWSCGLLIERWRGQPSSRVALVCSLVAGIGGLMFFKYADFFLGNINTLFGAGLTLLRLALPIGISFYTFQILSYTIDLYRGRAAVQRSLPTFCTYVMLFPQLIAGPIVRYVDVERELGARSQTLADFAAGARRFVIGLSKKVLIANVLGELADLSKNSAEESLLFAWLYIVAYAFHIYFDFSGYSDMAIGLGRIFGFHFLENFNYPYIAKSVTEFWRRWHISLSGWFRDYVYIPLGGNRVAPVRHIFNIFVVWFLTGFWHGAGWNFILWGLYFAVLLLLEKYVLRSLPVRPPRLLAHAWVALCVLVSWAFFDAPTLADALAASGRMFGIGVSSLYGPDSLYYLRDYAVPLLLAAAGCTPLPARLWAKWSEGRRLKAVLEPCAVAVLLLLVTSYLVDGSFNPFIYFRF
ncbi:MAG: MBOAT family protein [Gracilibacteraceae bacterium]|jgi:alginate O-acetyltransferase complex protein AlgI|nr:MBOAT family protein [Gracilibacteraceae bacterium]